MPDLGSYAFYVLAAYAGTLAAMALLVWWTLRRARKVRADLEAVENRARARK
jgi:heme exporter protein D